MDNPAEKYISETELRQFDGENGPIYIAYDGVVYDVTDSAKWRKGMHENLHFPGQDLTSEIDEAPHGDEVFNRPYIKVVGKIGRK